MRVMSPLCHETPFYSVSESFKYLVFCTPVIRSIVQKIGSPPSGLDARAFILRIRSRKACLLFWSSTGNAHWCEISLRHALAERTGQ
ncbi:hypothetical protein AN958_03557 [Leucoagaricus sp. SymC.cos]|nr:hypothetical protein AN958_03557 [Leucoagaricus sp. SymC.cos]